MTTRSQPSATLRGALEQARSGFERARLAALRDPGHEPDWSLLRRPAAWLASEEAQEALSDAAANGEISADERRWLEKQLAFVCGMSSQLQTSARLRHALGTLRLPSDEAFAWPGHWSRLLRVDDDHARSVAARELEHALRPIARAYAVDQARADAPLAALEASRPAFATRATRPLSQLIIAPFDAEALAPSTPELPATPWQAIGSDFLLRTESAAEDAVRYCLRAFKVGKPIPWHLLLRGLRAPELDSSSAAKQRWSRASAWLQALGFTSELQGRMRAEPDHCAALPATISLPFLIPRDVRVAQSVLDFGVASDVLAAEGAGRALALALCQSALPAELRWPVGPSVAGVMGVLGLQLWGDRDHLQRLQNLPGPAAERVGRLSGTIALLLARCWVALASAPRIDPEHPESGLEALAEALGRALCCEIPPSLAGLFGAAQLRNRACALEHLCALAAHIALRERFDTDWFRNPRAGELLRSGCERGNTLDPESFCSELGAPLSAASVRAIELVC